MIGVRAASRRRSEAPAGVIYPSMSVFPTDTQPQPTTNRRGILYWAELFTPTAVISNRRGRVFWAELETPTATGVENRRGRVYWSELQTPASGSSSTSFLDPNATISNNWTLTGAASAHLCLDDGVRDPSNPTSVGDSASITSSTSGQIAHLELGTFTLTGTVTGADLKVYTRNGNRRPLLAELTKADGTVLASTVVGSNATAGWYTATYTGALTQTEITGLRVKLTLQTVSGGGTTARIVDAVYVAVNVFG